MLLDFPDLSASESKIIQAESDKKDKWYAEKQELNTEVEYLNKQLESSKDMLEKEQQMQVILCVIHVIWKIPIYFEQSIYRTIAPIFIELN